MQQNQCKFTDDHFEIHLENLNVYMEASEQNVNDLFFTIVSGPLQGNKHIKPEWVKTKTLRYNVDTNILTFMLQLNLYGHYVIKVLGIVFVVSLPSKMVTCYLAQGILGRVS